MSERTCRECSEPIVGRKADALYCSTACAKRASRKRLRPERKLAEVAECPRCSETFTVWVSRACGGFARRTYCSTRCTEQAKAARYRQTETGRRYYEAYRDAGRFAENNRKMRARRRKVSTSTCCYCGTSFEHEAGRMRVTCGADECLKAHKRDSVNRRLALKKSATIEIFTSAEIFDRDRWVCQICGRKVNKALRHPDPLSVSLDHVIPLVEGGAHSRANTRCVHLRCNSVKNRYGGGEQLALI